MRINKKTEIGSQVRYLLCLYACPLLFLLAVVVVSKPMEIPMGMFMRDQAAVANIHPFIGIVSNMGVILWTSASVLCFFCGALILKDPDRKKLAHFLIYSGVVTLLLMLDDFFMLHEVIYKVYLGLDEKFVFAVYCALFIVGLLVYKQTIQNTQYGILIIAFLFYGFSMVVDFFQYPIQSFIGEDLRILLEDGSKFLGITGWFGYFLKTGYMAVRNLVA